MKVNALAAEKGRDAKSESGIIGWSLRASIPKNSVRSTAPPTSHSVAPDP